MQFFRFLMCNLRACNASLSGKQPKRIATSAESPAHGYPARLANCPARFPRKKESGIRESNPSHSLGKAGHSRYTNPASGGGSLPDSPNVQQFIAFKNAI